MKKFLFRLESVLGHRERVEKGKQIALTRVHQLVLDHEQRLLEAHVIVEAAREELRKHESGPEIDVAEARQHRLYIGSLRMRVAEMLKRLRKLEIELGQRRDEAVQARRERKVFETLKTRRHAEYLKEIERDERIELDDIAARKEVVRRAESREQEGRVS